MNVGSNPTSMTMAPAFVGSNPTTTGFVKTYLSPPRRYEADNANGEGIIGNFYN